MASSRFRQRPSFCHLRNEPGVRKPACLLENGRLRMMASPTAGKHASVQRAAATSSSGIGSARNCQRAEASEYLEGPPPDSAPAISVEDGSLPTRIRTILRAVNLECRFLRFAREDFRIFEKDYPSRITLVAGDDEQSIEVAVDYAKGILHGDELAEFIELQAWPYGAILWLEVTGSPDRFLLRAQPLEEPISLGSVSYFDINDDGEPVVKISHPKPIAVAIDQNVYREEWRWENRRAYDALVTRRGEGVLTAVFETSRSLQGRCPRPRSTAS